MNKLLSENGFKITFEMRYDSDPISNKRLVEMFGLAMDVPMLRNKTRQNRKWFIDILFGDAWYAFKEEKDAVMFKLAFSAPGMVTVIL